MFSAPSASDTPKNEEIDSITSSQKDLSEIAFSSVFLSLAGDNFLSSSDESGLTSPGWEYCVISLVKALIAGPSCSVFNPFQ